LALSVPLRGSRRESPVAQFLVVGRQLAHSMTFRFLIILVLGVLCSGCLKFERQVTSPTARGVVLDAQTHAPLSGADVVVSRLYDLSTNPPAISDALTNTRPPVVTTGKDGRFHIPAERHRELIVDYLIQPYKAPGGTLIVQRAGYQPAAIPLWGWLMPISAPAPTNFITVLLSPVSK
jgi:hypothetical protein